MKASNAQNTSLTFGTVWFSCCCRQASHEFGLPGNQQNFVHGPPTTLRLSPSNLAQIKGTGTAYAANSKASACLSTIKVAEPTGLLG